MGVPKLSIEIVKERVKEKYGDMYTVISETYVNNRTKMTFLHSECNEPFEARFSNLMLGHKCPNCAQSRPKSTEEFIANVERLTGDEYTVLGEYTKSNTKIAIRHNLCNHKYGVIYRDFVNRERRCPKCSKNVVISKDARKIMDFLTEHQINFEQEVKFDGCENIFSLPFDFYLPDINLLIEYDGEQHFIPRRDDPYGKKHEATKRNDRIKNEFVSEHEISLLRIRYDTPVLEILEGFLLKESSTTIEKYNLIYIE